MSGMKKKKNGPALIATRTKNMKNLPYLILLAVTVACGQGTSTPKKFINATAVSQETYHSDAVALANALQERYDSINSVANERQVVKILNIKTDTLFYGGGNRMVFLAILTKENKFSENGMQYAGECYIGTRKGGVEILGKLRYSATSTESAQKATDEIRSIYLGQMQSDEGEFNINDIRFWDSKVWREMEQLKARMESFEKAKIKNPDNVYDPNDRN